jgi:UDP-4-amino-4,6-dideoxy-N-acetyl-beta-L-altrosamine N-acetyltransferase
MFPHGNYNIHELKVVNFTRLSDEERKMVLDWRNHENIRKWMYSDDVITEEEHANFIDKLIVETSRFYWVVMNKEGSYLGTVNLNKIDLKNKHAYLGIYSNPHNQIKNKGRLLIQCIKHLAFEIAGIHTLKLEVIDYNQRAIKFYNESGFSEEGRLKEFIFKDGKWHDVIVMGIINE